MPAVQIAQSVDFFESLERAVRDTSRGQAFLDEYARRIRSAETQSIFQAIERLSAAAEGRSHTSNLDVLRRELESMASSIQQTRKEIASIKPQGEASNRIVNATEELDFVLKSTERATAEILSAAERVLAIAGELKTKGSDTALCNELETQGTELMMACSFQDLTGQRMSKVVNTLRYLELRVNAMIDIWGITSDEGCSTPSNPLDERPDAHLLNGPAREGEGSGQDDVDRLFSGAGATATDELATMPVGPASQNDIDQLFE